MFYGRKFFWTQPWVGGVSHRTPRAGPTQHLQPAGLRPSHAGPPGFPAVPGHQKPDCSRTQGPQRPLLSLGRCYILAGVGFSERTARASLPPSGRALCWEGPAVVEGTGLLWAPLTCWGDTDGQEARGGRCTLRGACRGFLEKGLKGAGWPGQSGCRCVSEGGKGRPLQGRGAEKLLHPPLPHRGAEPGRMPGPREEGSGTEACPLSTGSAACPDWGRTVESGWGCLTGPPTLVGSARDARPLPGAQERPRGCPPHFSGV